MHQQHQDHHNYELEGYIQVEQVLYVQHLHRHPHFQIETVLQQLLVVVDFCFQEQLVQG